MAVSVIGGILSSLGANEDVVNVFTNIGNGAMLAGTALSGVA
jgi:hypothetical protein